MKYSPRPIPYSRKEPMTYDFDLAYKPPAPLRTDFKIGVVGAGFIVRDIQLVAYRNAGYHVAGIASRSAEVAQEVAHRREIPRAYESISSLLADPLIEVLDIAVPPESAAEARERGGDACRSHQEHPVPKASGRHIG
jgi:hypothetical protein